MHSSLVRIFTANTKSRHYEVFRSYHESSHFSRVRAIKESKRSPTIMYVGDRQLHARHLIICRFAGVRGEGYTVAELICRARRRGKLSPVPLRVSCLSRA